MLTVHGLDVFYGRVQALRRVSLHVAAGELVTIVGAERERQDELFRL